MRAVVRVLCVFVCVVLAADSIFAASDKPAASNRGTTRLVMATTSDVASSAEPAVPIGADTNTVYLKPARSAPGVSSAMLAQQAWKALEKEQYDQAIKLADQCEERFGTQAQKQQGMLKALPSPDKAFSYAALNDVATCLYIKGKALQGFRRYEEAKSVFQAVIREYRFAQCWDPKGWFWKVAGAAQDQIYCMQYDMDFGDYTSSTLTAKAWKAYVAHRYEAMELYARKCIELYGATAKQMQSTLSAYPPKGEESDYWALNDVATCLYIRGKALQRQGHNKDAALAYREIIDNYPFAQCYDPNGWYWKIADEAKRNLQFCG